MGVIDTQMVAALIQALEQEAKGYQEILDITKAKTRLIIDGKADELEKFIKLEQSAVLKVSPIEGTRQKLVNKIAEQLGVEKDSITISEIIKHVKKDQAEKLKFIQIKILEIVNDLKDTNILNSKLIKNSLDYIDFSINLLTNVGSGNNNYGSTGATSEFKKRTFFDMKL